MKKYEVETDNLIYKKTNYFLSFLGQAFIALCAIIAVFIIGFEITYDSAPVYGVSMQPTLNPLGSTKSDLVYINTFGKYTYGDIIVVKKSASIDSDHIIKRVIGLAGDTIDIRQDTDGEVYVFRNGKKLVEDYIYDIKTSGEPGNLGMRTTLDNFINLRVEYRNNSDQNDIVFDKNGRLVIQKGQVFVLGDNRGRSIDSSIEGPFKTSDVVGKVDFVVPYGTAPFYYFLKYYTGIDLSGIINVFDKIF